MTGIDLGQREVQFAEMAPLALRLPRAGARRPRSTSSASRARRSTPSRCTPSPTPCASRSTSCERWEAADRDPALVEDGALNVVVVGGGPDGRRERRRARRALPQQLRQGLSRASAGEGADRAGRGRRRRSSRCSSRTSAPTRRRSSRSAAWRCSWARWSRPIEPTRVTLKSGDGARGAHARLGRRAAGEPARRVARGRAAARQAHRRPSPTSASPATPRCSPSATSPGSPTRRRTRSCRSSARSRCRPASMPGENIARRVDGKEAEPFRYFDKGTMATIGRGAAVIQMPRGGRSRARPRGWRGARSTSPCCPPARTAPRRSSTGRGRGSRTSALAGSPVERDRRRRRLTPDRGHSRMGA